MNEPALLAFGPFLLDAARRVLWREGNPVAVTPRALDVLAALVRRPGELVTKDELLRQVWPDTFVEEANLTVNVSALRKALGRQPDGRPYIETLSRRGYRFVGPAARGSRSRSLAVLPFVPMTSGVGEELGLGMADALITRLGRLGQLVVRPTGAVARYATTRPDPLDAGRALAVDLVLEGRLQRSGDRLRLTVQLVGVADRAPVWADAFDEPAGDLFALQDALGQRLAEALTLTLGASERSALARRPTEDPAAYREYLRGRHFWNRLTGPSLQKALAAFEAAVEHDPAFASAWAGLADTHAMRAVYGLEPGAVAWPRARVAAGRALELDPALAEARISLAYVLLLQDWDWKAAEAELARAVELAPASAGPHQWHAMFLAAAGRFDEAAGAIERARQLDPLSLTVSTSSGVQLYLRQQYDPEIDEHRRSLELDPDYALAHWALGLAYEQKGLLDEAIAEQQRALALSGGSLLLESVLGRAYARAGRRADAEAVLAELDRRSGRAHVAPYQAAGICVALGDREQAFAYLERGRAQRDHWMVWLKVDPVFEPLRSDRRFDGLLRAVFG